MSADGGSLLLDVPPDFHQVPLDDAVEDRVAARGALVESLGLSDPQQREGLELYVEALAGHVRRSRVAASAFCLVELDGAPSTATLTVALHPAGSTADPTVLLLGVAESLRRDGGYDAVGIERIQGRAVVVAHGGAAPTPDGAERQRQLTVAVPLAAQQQVVMLALASPDHAHWAVYERLVRQVAASVRIDP